MKIIFVLLSGILISAPALAADIFRCQFQADEKTGTRNGSIEINTPDVGAKVLYLANGELVFALPNVSGSTAQLDLYVGSGCDGCTAVRFYQSDVFQKGGNFSFTSTGVFNGSTYAKSVFNYSLECSATP